MKIVPSPEMTGPSAPDAKADVRPPVRGGSGPLVCIVAYDSLCAFEYGIGLEVFGLPRPEFDIWYDLAIVAAEPGPMRALGGLSVAADHGLNRLADADVILVPGWRGADAAVPVAFAEALRLAHERGARVASICSGAFALAAAGLLDGRRATTHWRYAAALAKACPAACIEPNVLYVVDGRIMTSAGSAAGLDLCLHIVREDFGVETANAVARRLVLPAHRDGAQPQILGRPVAHERGGRIAPLLDRMRARPGEPWPVGRMADAAGLTRRTFARRFWDATGQTPLAWLTAVRMDRARDLLGQTNAAVRDVAAAVGFGSAETFRRTFREVHGMSPSDWRRTIE